jgi:hypothetical protein
MSLTLDLPQAREDIMPAFPDVKSCTDWIAALALTNTAASQSQLRGQLGLLAAAAAVSAPVLMEMLEKLRAPVLAVQEDAGRKFGFRPLPLADTEAAAFAATVDLWRAYGLAWRVCLKALQEGDALLKPRAALIAQRTLDVQVRLIIDCLNAGMEIAVADWQHLHRLYGAAEALDVVAEPVRDSHLFGTRSTQCGGTYARAILLALGAPNEWNARQAPLIARWNERWSNKVVIGREVPAEPVKPPVAVDLASGSGGFRPEAPGAAGGGQELRYLDISGVVISIRNRIARLRKGETPASLGLGEDCAMPATEQTLMVLYRHWGDGRTGREQVRRAASGRTLVASGIAAIHHYTAGTPFKQPGHATELSAKQRQEIATFGRVATRDDEDHSLIHGLSLEDWALKDESVAGLRLTRAAGAVGSRFTAGMLIGARPSDSRVFIIGTVRWVQQQANGELMAGIKAVPGAPQAVAVRQTGINATAEKYHQALMMPAMPALQSPASVLLPAQWFKPGRVLDVHADRQWLIRLVAVLERGVDFDRCSYELTPG